MASPAEQRLDEFIWFYQNVEAIGGEHGDLSKLNEQYGIEAEATDAFSTEVAARLLPTFRSELQRALALTGRKGNDDLLLVTGFATGFRFGELLTRMIQESDGKGEASEPSQND